MANKTTLIITTRFFPPFGKWLKEEDLEITFEKEKLCYQLFEGDDDDRIYINKRVFDNYEVYVAPCLKRSEDIKNSDRKKYLNEIINKIFKSSCPSGKSYLFAHDYDFNQNGHGIINPIIPNAECSAPCFENFVKQQKVFLFQHGSLPEIVPFNAYNSSFEEEHCENLIRRYDELETERDLRMKINSSPENIYPYPINKVTR